jgi:hypothetical protein
MFFFKNLTFKEGFLMVALSLPKVGRKPRTVRNFFLQIVSLTYPEFPKSTPNFELSHDKLFSILSFLFYLHRPLCPTAITTLPVVAR